MTAHISGAAHLARRFAGALRPGGPGVADDAWASGLLGPGEVALWRQMSVADRRHAVGVARSVSRMLGPLATTAVLAAALLHDVGKLAAGLGTWARVPATLVGLAGGHSRAQAWTERRVGARRSVGLYLRHAPLGAVMLQAAGADPLTSTWAAEHHLPASAWTVPVVVGKALKEADDD